MSNPLSNMLGFVRSLTDGSFEASRKDIFRDEFENIIVDTVCTPDTSKWETGIQKDKGKWVIVQQYETRNLAEKGHAEWVRKLTENRKLVLKDIDVWNIDEFFGDKED